MHPLLISILLISTIPKQLNHHLIQAIVTRETIQIMENFDVDQRLIDWLVYSKKMSLYFCKVFSTVSHKLTDCNWRHLSINVSRYENGMEHMKAVKNGTSWNCVWIKNALLIKNKKTIWNWSDGMISLKELFVFCSILLVKSIFQRCQLKSLRVKWQFFLN